MRADSVVARVGAIGRKAFESKKYREHRIDIVALLRPSYDDFAGLNLLGHFRSPISRSSAISVLIGTRSSGSTGSFAVSSA